MTTTRALTPGLNLRWRRLFRPDTQRSFILPLDHGITHGVNRTLARTAELVSQAMAAGADAVLLRPGLMRTLAHLDFSDTGVIIALTGRLSGGTDHVGLNSVEEAVRAGADAVAVELKLGSPGELANAQVASRLREEAHLLGLPVLVMIYPVQPFLGEKGGSAFVHACRIGEEMGADFIKTAQPDDETLQLCLEAITVPLLVAGGGGGDSFDHVVERVSTATRLGVSGAAVGRSVFNADAPGAAVSRLVAAVHGGRG